VEGFSQVSCTTPTAKNHRLKKIGLTDQFMSASKKFCKFLVLQTVRLFGERIKSLQDLNNND